MPRRHACRAAARAVPTAVCSSSAAGTAFNSALQRRSLPQSSVTIRNRGCFRPILTLMFQKSRPVSTTNIGLANRFVRMYTDSVTVHANVHRMQIDVHPMYMCMYTSLVTTRCICHLHTMLLIRNCPITANTKCNS